MKTWWLNKCGYWGLPCDTTSEEFWAMLGAVGTVSAALLTALAVSVALWQSWKAMQDEKTKVRINSTTESRKLADIGTKTFLRFELVNFGMRSVVINRVSLILPNKEVIFSKTERKFSFHVKEWSRFVDEQRWGNDELYSDHH